MAEQCVSVSFARICQLDSPTLWLQSLLYDRSVKILKSLKQQLLTVPGLVLYGIGALCMWPAGLHRSFGGFCGATFVIGSGLGSLETAANPFMAGMFTVSSKFG
jgi:hypothetical protein